MGKKSRAKHLLIVRLSAMGDVAMTVFAVRALRANYPDLRITMLTRELFQPLFDGLEVEFIPLDLKGRHRGVWGIWHLAREISKLGVDYVVDLHSVLRTAMLRTMLSMHLISSVKLRKDRFGKWMRMEGGCNEVTRPLKHTVIRYCDTLRRGGFQIENPQPSTRKIHPNPMPFAKGEGERWIGVAPFSAHQGKCYPKPLVREVVAELAKRYDRVFIHTGGGAELEFAQDLEASHSNVVAIFKRVTLRGEIDLIANLDCLISMDSFAMHVGSLVATPVVSIWGATHPALGFSCYGQGCEGIIELVMDCRPCSTYGKKPCRFGDYRCLAQIPPQDVVDRVAQLIR